MKNMDNIMTILRNKSNHDKINKLGDIYIYILKEAGSQNFLMT